MTQLFDQMTAPDPAPLPMPTAEVQLDLDRLFNQPSPEDLDLSRFFGPPPARGSKRRAPRTLPHDCLRARAPGVVLVAAGGLLGIAVARL